MDVSLLAKSRFESDGVHRIMVISDDRAITGTRPGSTIVDEGGGLTVLSPGRPSGADPSHPQAVVIRPPIHPTYNLPIVTNTAQNVLAATGPDVFAAGIAYVGVPATCFYTSTVDVWNSLLAGPVESQPGNYYETIKQWTGVFGYSTTPSAMYPDTPRSPYARYVFGPNVEGVLGEGITHNIDIFGDADMEWFGVTGSSTTTATSGPISTLTTTKIATATPTTGTGGAQYAQCGGIGWTGVTTCASPYTCHKLNDYFSQCF
ncbi:hypothetical protein F4801DRAFT_582638 [Xylaria longipes]|nr:hypothetical protein F4801DRAFT_582638 [Xylaria longipes]